MNIFDNVTTLEKLQEVYKTIPTLLTDLAEQRKAYDTYLTLLDSLQQSDLRNRF